MIYCIGEIVIDMFCLDRDTELKDGVQFQKMIGGAPANVAATIAKLGGDAGFAGSVGQDSFGDFLIEMMEKYDVKTNMIQRDSIYPTTISFISLTADGERDFQINRGADRNFTVSDQELLEIMTANILHFGSATAFLSGELRETYFNLMSKGKKDGRFISFDPNFRSDLWKNNVKDFIASCEQAISYADFVKVSEEELALITGTNDLALGAKKLHALGTEIVTVTLGKQGTFLSVGNEQATIQSIEVKNIDSTGAGDAFVGAMLSQFELQQTVERNFNNVQKMVEYANIVGAFACTKVGALAAIPTNVEVMQYLERKEKI